VAAVLRPAAPADAPGVLALYAPLVRDTHVSFEAVSPTADEVAGRIARTLERFPWLVCEDEEDLLGYAYAGPHRDRSGYRWSAEVSVYVAPAAHRRGVGRALYTALLGLLAAQGYVNVYAGIALPNDASVGLHEALGFRLAARYPAVGFKAGAWRDVGWWHRRINPLAPAPAPPVPFPALGAEAVAGALRAGETQLKTG
jgi:phosphinothricin acetyltransferase